MRSLLVSFSVTSTGTTRSAYSHRGPSSACCAATPLKPGASVPEASAAAVGGGPPRAVPTPGNPRSVGFSAPPAHDQVCRNHSVGTTCNTASSGPRLWMVTCNSTSSGPALAYSTKTSK